MGKYYALVAGLPNLSIEAQRAPYTQEEFYLELEDILSNKDKDLLDWLRLEEDNRRFIELYNGGVFAPKDEEDEEHNSEEYLIEELFPLSEIRRITALASRGIKTNKSDLLPYYMVRFLSEAYYVPTDEEEQPPSSPLSPEDRLAQLYYSSATNSKNKFIASWFRFNQILRNILTIYTCRQLGWDAEQYIVGNGEEEQLLLSSRAKDFELSERVPYISSIIHIAEEGDIAKREKLIDALRWRWLEEETERTVFDIENVLSYYLRLGIIERWASLNKEQGEEIFRRIVSTLKRESNASLSEFRRKHKNR